jgi:hypothetical protein
VSRGPSHLFLRLAARRWPESTRASWLREWEAELAAMDGGCAQLGFAASPLAAVYLVAVARWTGRPRLRPMFF